MHSHTIFRDLATTFPPHFRLPTTIMHPGGAHRPELYLYIYAPSIGCHDIFFISDYQRICTAVPDLVVGENPQDAEGVQRDQDVFGHQGGTDLARDRVGCGSRDVISQVRGSQSPAGSTKSTSQQLKPACSSKVLGAGRSCLGVYLCMESADARDTRQINRNPSLADEDGFDGKKPDLLR